MSIDRFLYSSWKHWGCVSPKVIAKMQELYSDPSDLDGFDDLKPEDKDRINKALQDGHVAEDDIPESAKEGEEKTKKKAASRKRKDTEAKGEAFHYVGGIYLLAMV